MCSENDRKLFISLKELENAFIQYDEGSDTLYINLSDEEAEEVLMLENDIVVRIRGDKLLGITILNFSKRFKSEI